MTVKWEYSTLTNVLDGSWVRAKPGCTEVDSYSEEDFGEALNLLKVLTLMGDEGWEVCARVEEHTLLLKRPL